MKYVKQKNKIIVTDLSDFNIKQTLDCGQIFRFKIDGNLAYVYSTDKQAVIETNEEKIVSS